MVEQKIYTIPLRKSFQDAAPKKRTPKAVRALKSYVLKHTKVQEVKIGAVLNELLWARGILHPPHKVTVNVLVDKDVAKVELEGHTYKDAVKPVAKKEQSAMQKLVSKVGGKPKASSKDESSADEVLPSDQEGSKVDEEQPPTKEVKASKDA